MTRISRIFKFNNRNIEALPPQPPDASSSNYETTDAGESGLKIAVYKSGKKAFRHRYTFMGVKKMMTLGTFPAVSIDRARERVRENKALMAEDIDPREERQAKRDVIDFKTFTENHFLPHAKQTMRSFKDAKSRINKWLLPAFGNKKLTQITRQNISKFHLSLRKMPPTANRSLSLLSAMFRLAIELELLTENPCRGIPKLKENGSRKRVLSSDEMQRFMTALIESTVTLQGKAAFLLLGTGKRKTELLSAKYSHVDWDNRQIHLPVTKNGEAGFALLNSHTYELLKKMEQERDKSVDWIFPSKTSASGHLTEIRRTFKRICENAGVTNFKIHDMRRAYASTLINADIPLNQVKELLNHKDIRTTLVYARLNTASLQNANETAGKEMEKYMPTA
jgi:integrase